jgi:hypothetical protein
MWVGIDVVQVAHDDADPLESESPVDEGGARCQASAAPGAGMTIGLA